MTKFRQLALVAAMAASFASAPLQVQACSADSAKTFNSGPLDPAGSQLGLFSEWVVDTNGIGLQVCNDQVDLGGGAFAPCIVTPVVPGNTLSAQLGRGVEGFFYLANSKWTSFDRTGAQAIDTVIVMAQEAAFLSAEPAVGFQTQFSRLRVRLNVAKVGNYTVETPWRTDTYRVDTLLPPGNGQNRSEISVPIDVTFPASATNAGMVTPYLVADNKPALTGLINPLTGVAFNPAEYIGDGVTLTTVHGSPCGTNYVKVTAVGLDGVTPVDINNGSNVYVNNTFTISGKLAPVAAVPMAIGNAYYTRNAGADSVTVMAEGSTSATQQASMSVQVGPTTTVMTRDVTNYFANVAVPGVAPITTVPATTISVTASDPGLPSTPNTQTATLKDLVTISKAQADCTGVGRTRSCVLTVNANSSDDGSAGAVTLTVLHSNTPLVNGAAAVTSAAVPAAVTVVSTSGGSASRAVTVLNH
jgi:hypothetical protein